MKDNPSTDRALLVISFVYPKSNYSVYCWLTDKRHSLTVCIVVAKCVANVLN